MTVYISRDGSEALEHYGVKGMKWGVRHDKPRLGTSARTLAKRDRIQAKINKGGDRNIVYRNTINDYRRGRVQALNRKAEHRKAAENYRSGKGSRDKLRMARANRLVYNVGSKAMLGVSNRSRGQYNRYRSNGETVTNSVLKTVGRSAIEGAAYIALIEAGKSAWETWAIKQMFNSWRV